MSENRGEKFAGRHPSVADIPESTLVKAVLENPHTRGHVLDIYGFPENPIWRVEVSMEGLPGRRGDVDILAWNEAHPEKALAIEVKRFKANVSGSEDDRINKMQEYEKGVRQVNRLADIGFALVWLLVFVLVDSRRQNAEAIAAGKTIYEGLSPELYGLVNSSLSTSGLDPRVGVMHVEYVQSMDEIPLFGVGTSGVHLVRMGRSAVQSAALSEWVRARG